MLFTDIEGSTDAVKAVGADCWESILERHAGIIRDSLAGLGGFEVRTEGDSFFAVFTSPTAAVVAAAEIQRRLHSADWDRQAPVRVRMGIHTGETRPASAASGADYVGFEVSRAARIAAAAHGGQVLVSDTTEALVRDTLAPGLGLRELGEHRFKDLVRPQRVYQLLIDGLPDSFPQLRTLDATPNDLATQTAFVGRMKELAQLRAGLDRMLVQRGATFFLQGEPGIGKTRLAEELAEDARHRGAVVFWGRCTHAAGAPPYWPWVQILRALLRDLGHPEFGRLAGPGLAQILQIVPELRVPFPDVTPASIEDDATRFAVYDSVTQLLLNTAGQRPLLLVLEDLHWADASSVILLQLLAGAIPHAAIMVIGTYRERELVASHPLRAQLADFVRRGETVEIPLEGLSHTDIASLLRDQTAFEAEENFVRRLQAQTAGNPFFLKELMRALGEESSAGTPSQVSATGEAVPRGVAAVLRDRIESVSGDCRQMLEVAAVAGDELEVDLLEAAIGTGRARLLDLCDEAVAYGIVGARERGFAFTHGLFRDTVYNGLSTVHRSELHGLVAQILEKHPPQGVQSPGVRLAYHLVQAASADQALRAKAAQHAAGAARQAMAELAYEVAVRLFEQALVIGAPADSRERAQLLLDLGRARYMAGDIGGALDAADEVSVLGDKLDDANVVARAALVVRGVGGPGLSHRIVRLCTEATKRPIDDRALKVQVLSQLTVALMQTGIAADERAAKDASREAVELAADAIDTDVVFAGIHARQMATSGPDGVDERLELAERTLRLARETGRASMANWAHTWRLDALVQLGRIDEADNEVAVQLKLADELHEPLARWRALQAEAWLALLRGRFVQAGALAEEARQLGRRGHHAAAEFGYLTHVVVMAVYVGGLDAALMAMEAFMRPLSGISGGSAIFVSGALALMGRLEEARAALRQMAAVRFQEIGPAIAFLPGVALVTEAVYVLADRDAAPQVYEAALPFARLNVSAGAAGLYGSVARYLGMLATTLERWEDGARHFEEGMDLEQRMGAPPFLARTRIAYAEMLVKRGRDTDLHHARKLLDAALATSRDLGMKPWEDRASDLLARLISRGVADHPLSGREFEVATLVAEGLSNREIAGRLHLSERTAESHIKNICDKLGFNSRSQVAAWVAARGPIT